MTAPLPWTLSSLPYPSSAKESATAFNDAFKEWQAEHGSNPESVQQLLAEHAELLAKAPRAAKPADIPKRVSAISQQMAAMVSQPGHLTVIDDPANTTYSQILILCLITSLLLVL